MNQKKKLIFKLIISVILLMLIGISVIRVDNGNINLLANKEEIIPKAISYAEVKNSNTSIASQNCTFDGKDYSSTNPIIPAGFKPVSTADDSTITTTWGTNTGNDGLVIEDDAGNQYVWVPVENYTELAFDYDECYTDGEYEYPNFENGYSYASLTLTGGKGISEGAEISDNTEKTNSIKKYGGYYISRYELAQDNSGNTVSKAELNPITSKTKAQAQTICENLYSSNSYVGSELVGINDWNQMVKWVWPNITKIGVINGSFLVNEGETIEENYSDYFDYWSDPFESITGYGMCEDIKGNIGRCDDSNAGGGVCWGYEHHNNGDLTLKTTGIQKYKNIYDLAGNVEEYVEAGNNNYVIGGAYDSVCSAWYRK